MIPMSFEDVFFEVFVETFPGVNVRAEIDNIGVAHNPASGPEFPLLMFEVTAREVVGLQTGWTTQEEMAWEVDLVINLLAPTQEIGQFMLDVHKAIKGLERAILSDDAGRPFVAFGRFDTISFFSSVGQAPLVGGKVVSQKNGQYSVQLKEIHHATAD